MDKISINLKKIECVRCFPKEKKAKVLIGFEVNGNYKEFIKEYQLINSEELVKNILANVKDMEKYEKESDDVLKSIVIVDIDNHEKVEEKLLHFFGKYYDKINNFKSMKTHEDYIQSYSELNGYKMEL